jgi:hypothetical protein
MRGISDRLSYALGLRGLCSPLSAGGGGQVSGRVSESGVRRGLMQQQVDGHAQRYDLPLNDW